MSPLAAALAFQQPIMPVPQSTISPVDVVGAYRSAQDAQMKAYQAKIAQQNAMWGGLASLGSAGILGAPGLSKMFSGAGAGTGLTDATATVADAGIGDAAAAGIGDAAAATSGASVMDLLPLLLL